MALLLLFCAGCGGEDSGLAEPPNVVFLMLDTLRADRLSCYGYGRETSPAIDRLAERGVLFERNFTQATWTGESVSSMLTGRYFPVEYINVPQLREIRRQAPGERLLPEILRENGYESVMITMRDAWFSRRSRLVRAFDELLAVEPRNPAKATFEELMPEIDAYLSRPHEKPFLMYVHAFDQHFPHEIHPPYDRWVDPSYRGDHIVQDPRFGARSQRGPELSQDDRDYLGALYDGSILYTDHHVDRLLAKLDALDLLESTILVLSSDHGEALAEDGRTIAHSGAKTYDEVTHVPLIVAGPGVPAGRRISRITENVDIVPTLVDLLGLESQAAFDGESAVPRFSRPGPAGPAGYGFTKFAEGGGYSLRGEAFRYEQRRSGSEHLYPAPDRIGRRIDVLAENREVADVMRGELGARLAADRPGPLIAILLGLGELLGENGSSPPPADGAPIDLRAPVPNGRYDVLVELLCTDGESTPNLEIQIEDERASETVTCDPARPDSALGAFVHLGRQDVRDGFFDARVPAGLEPLRAGVRRFALVVDGAGAMADFLRIYGPEASDPDQEAGTIERLRALGYL